MLGSLYASRSLLLVSYVAQVALSIYTLVLLILSLVLTVVVPRVALVDNHLVVSVQVGGVVTSLGQYLGRYPATRTQVVEQCTLNVVVEVELGEVIIHRIVVACRTPRWLNRDIDGSRHVGRIVVGCCAINNCR